MWNVITKRDNKDNYRDTTKQTNHKHTTVNIDTRINTHVRYKQLDITITRQIQRPVQRKIQTQQRDACKDTYTYTDKNKHTYNDNTKDNDTNEHYYKDNDTNTKTYR